MTPLLGPVRAAILSLVAISFLAGGHAVAVAATDAGLVAGRQAVAADVAGVRQVRTVGDLTGQRAKGDDASDADDSGADTDDSESADSESTDSESTDSEDSEDSDDDSEEEDED